MDSFMNSHRSMKTYSRSLSQWMRSLGVETTFGIDYKVVAVIVRNSLLWLNLFPDRTTQASYEAKATEDVWPAGFNPDHPSEEHRWSPFLRLLWYFIVMNLVVLYSGTRSVLLKCCCGLCQSKETGASFELGFDLHWQLKAYAQENDCVY